MHVFQPVAPQDVDEGAFSFMGNKFLVTSANKDKVNSTAVSFGGVGQIWGKRIVFVLVRADRLIKEYMDASGEFSISFLNPTEFRGALKYMELVSGRDEDKIANARLTVNYNDGIPFIDEADNVITAKVLFAQECEEESFFDKDLIEEFYKKDEHHYMYIGEIQKILIR